jgi:hypothetical protein
MPAPLPQQQEVQHGNRQPTEIKFADSSFSHRF